jgi:WD40 repeat protein
VPGYEILDVLGKGGMGVVYRARHVALDRVVALKLILQGEHANDAERQRFWNEARAVAQLQHPHIVQVFETGTEDRPYMALEYCAGGSLARTLTGTPWAAGDAARLVETVALAMHAAHQAKLIHRDLKPANILLTTDGQPKVGDFGLVKKLDVSSQTHTGVIVGTPSYMSPEQAAGRTDITAAADVYALGAILYELLTGRPPFRGPTAMETVLQVINDEPVTPARLNPSIPRDLETICLKCLEKEMPRRYADAAALAEDLRRFQAGEPVVARPTGRLERAIKWARRRPTAAALSVVSVVAAVALVVGIVSMAYSGRLADARDEASRQRDDAQEQRQTADRQRAAAEAAQAEAERQRTRAEWLGYAGQLSRTQRELQDNNLLAAGVFLDTCQWDMCGWEHAYLRRRVYGPDNTIAGIRSPPGVIAYSPDGRLLAGACPDGTVRIWEPDRPGPPRVLPGHPGGARGVAWAPDGTRLASCGNDGMVRFWNPLRGTQTQEIHAHNEGASSISFSADGRRLASSGVGAVKIWDTVDGRQVVSLKGHSTLVFSVAFSPDGTRLASGGNDGTLRIWDVAAGRELYTLRDHGTNVYCVAFSPDGRRLASGGADKRVRLWDPMTGRMLAALQGHSGQVASVSFSPDARRLASSGTDLLIKLWDVDGRDLGTLRGHGGHVDSVGFRSDGARLASASKDGTIRFWAPAAEPEVWSPPSGGFGFGAAAFNLDGTWVAVGAADGMVRVWDPVKGRVVQTFAQHGKGLLTVTVSSDGRLLASGSEDQTAKVWDRQTGELVRTFAGHTAGVWAVALSPDNRRLATAGRDNTVRLWDVRTGHRIELPCDERFITNVVRFSPDGQLLAGCGFDGLLRVWDVATGKPLQALQKHTKPVFDMAFSPDGARLATAGIDATEQVWDTRTWETVLTLDTGLTLVHCVTFSPDGRRLVGGGQEPGRPGSPGLVKVWELTTGQEVLALKVPTEAVTALRFRPDGRCLMAAGAEGKVFSWQVAASAQPQLLRGPDGGTSAGVAFSSDGRRIVARFPLPDGVGPDVVRCWDAGTGAEVRPCTDAVPPRGQETAVAPDHSANVFAADLGVLVVPRGDGLDQTARLAHDVWVHDRLAADASDAGNTGAALFHRRRAARLQGDDAAIQAQLALACIEDGLTAEGDAACALALKLDPTTPLALVVRAGRCLEQGDEKAYRDCCARLLPVVMATDPSQANPWLEVFALAPAAIPDLKPLLSRQMSPLARSALLLRAGQLTEAFQPLFVLAQLAAPQEQASAFLLLALLHTRLGQRPTAILHRDLAHSLLTQQRGPGQPALLVGASGLGPWAAAPLLFPDTADPLRKKFRWLGYLHLRRLQRELDEALGPGR